VFAKLKQNSNTNNQKSFMKYGFIIDNRKCIGCHACTTACKSEHEVPVGVFRTHVKQVEKGTFPDTRRLFSVMRCNHCTDAPCVEICPVEALYFRPDGIVDFDKDRCIGCKSCMQACPYDALYIDPDTHTAAKCNYCAHRIDVGLEPACVNVCPEHAIISGDMENPDTEIAQLLSREQTNVRKPEKGTIPNLFYIDGDAFSLVPSSTDRSDNYFWSEQSHGVGHFAKNTEKLALSDAQYTEKLAYNGDDLMKTLMQNNGQTTETDGTPQKSIDVLTGQNVKRVYDAPDKGILWGWEVAAYVMTKAVSAGAFLVPFIGMMMGKVENSTQLNWWTVGVGMLFLMITGGLLVKDLDRPDRFIYVLLRPQWKSWLTKGGFAITIYGGLLAILGGLTWFGVQNGILMMLLQGFTAATAVIVAVYTAFLFAQAKGRDFWQSPVAVLQMATHSIMAGASAYLITGATGFLQNNSFFNVILGVGIVVNLLGMLVELTMTHPTADGKRTVQAILKGQYTTDFWTKAIGLGNIIPLAMLYFANGDSFVMALAGVLVLLGIYFTERIWIEAPQRIALV
jgi:Fe-S-cluster-containing dehydrogenase component/formate-dependent nitrite reductase membrane component NrfD